MRADICTISNFTLFYSNNRFNAHVLKRVYYTTQKLFCQHFLSKNSFLRQLTVFQKLTRRNLYYFPNFLYLKLSRYFSKNTYIAFSNLNASLLLISKFLSAYLSLKYRLIDPRLSAEYSSFASKTSERGYSLGYIAVYARRNEKLTIYIYIYITCFDY